MQEKTKTEKKEKPRKTSLFSKLSIKRKLVLIIMLVTSSALILAGSAFIGYQWITARQRLVSELSAHADLLIENTTAALTFNDRRDAEEILNTLHSRKAIAFACIYRPDGSFFANYKRENFSGMTPPTGILEKGYQFDSGWLVMNKKITLNDEFIGTLFLQSDLSELTALIKQITIPLLIMVLLSSIAAYFFAARLQEVISRPLFHLAKTAKKISKNEDYSLRAEKHSEDEIGQLTDAFNNMLRQVEKRDIALRESEEKYRSLYDTSRDAIMISKPDGRIISANPATLKLFGYQDESKFIGLYLADLSPKYQLDGKLSCEKAKNDFALTLEKGAHFFEWVHLHADGFIFHAEVLLNRMQLQGEQVIHASIRNITERKQHEEELRRLRNLLSNIINSMPSVLVGVDMEGRVTHWNREAEKITGLKADQARGSTLVDVFPELAGEMEKVAQAIRDREPLKDEKIPSRKIGNEIRYSDITVYPLIPDGVEGAVIRMDDVTERVRIEEMVIQSEKMLSVGGLAAGMAHEINNPLAGILQNVQVIRNRIRSGLNKNDLVAKECGTSVEVIESYVEKRGIFAMIDAVMESGRRASKIVDNMLSFSRKSESNFAPHNMAVLLDKTVELASNDYNLKKKYDFRQIEIIREYEEKLPDLMCEGSKLQQVFLNLLKNGAQAMAEKTHKQEPPRFILRVKKEDGMVRVEIEDNGPGMDEATRKRIFEPFFTTKGVGVGTGLGLSVSYFIITENHSGTMVAESTPGKGTNFIIRLPLNNVERRMK